MTIKQVQAKFNFDVENQLLSCPYDIYTVNSSYPFLAEYKDDKSCWTCQRDASGTGFGIVFTTDIIQVEFDLTVDNIDGFCVLVGINNTLRDGSSSRFHLVNVSKSYPSYGNYIWWNPDKAKIDDGVLDANKWVHMVIDKTSIKIYDLNSNLLYSRSKPADIVDITLSSDENYQPYITNMTVTFNYSQNFLDSIGLTTLWSKIKSLFATKTELSAKANDSDVVHKSGDEIIAGTKTFNNKIKLVGNTDLITNTSDSTYTNIVGGTSSNTSPYLQLVGKDWNYEPNRGRFVLCANDGTNGCELEGKPNGTLTWSGKNVDGIDSSNFNWIRYFSGLQIVFSTTNATFNNNATANVTVTLPVAFKDSNYQVITENSGGGTDFLLKMTTDKHTTTSFDLYCKNETNISGSRQVRYIAVGFWK